MKYWPTKTAAAIRDLGLNWGPTLAKLSDMTIVASNWTVLRGDVDADALGSISADGLETTTRVSGGTAGTETVFRNTVTLSNGLVLDEDVFLKVRA